MIRVKREDFDPREVSNVDKKASARAGVMYLAESTSLSVKFLTQKFRCLFY